MKNLGLAQRTLTLKPSQIREVAEAGMNIDGIIPLWFGESAWPTPQLGVDAAINALNNADHFYQPNSGKATFRQAICDYQTTLLNKTFSPNRITVTASGMQGLALVAQALITTGDKVLAIEPTWPNVIEAFRISGAEVTTQNLEVKNGKWSLNLDRFLAALTPDIKAVVINSPHNPTGWTMPELDMKAIFDHCQKLGIWIVADDVYARLYKHANTAPSFLKWATDQDRVISINSFSKAWSMTGWRLGWICAPKQLEQTLAMLSEFNIAGPAGFIQQAGATMLAQGEPEIAKLTSRLNAGYAIAETKLKAMQGVDFIEPDGAFYCFFKVDGMTNSLTTAKNLLHITKVGTAPGAAFGPSGQGYLRICYAQPPEILSNALDKLAAGLAKAKV
ncbi:MAG: aspartate/tyrosine/aromatic aminotransferase [Hyphomicrobiales bacterium]|nr:MAG: aspartate/tyrosine/aromatic aminotransferase [Hyphomicrobiales bacterium]